LSLGHIQGEVAPHRSTKTSKGVLNPRHLRGRVFNKKDTSFK